LVKIVINMKSSYELAMERLAKASPTVKLSSEQKQEIAEAESQCVAKVAAREVFLKGEIAKAIDAGDAEAVERLEKQLMTDRQALRAECEAKKDQVRRAG
jgi:hypothetical protein